MTEPTIHPRRRAASRSSTPQDTRTDSIGSLSFQSLLFTQWLTAINDNAFRWLVVGIGKDYVDQSQESWILAMGLACFVLPYLLLASIAGYLADRFHKRDVIIVCKVAEIVIMTLGILAIAWGNLSFLFVVVGLMGAQSALFSPAKMGSIPELLPAEKMSAANGQFGFSTVTATIVGMAIGLILSDYTGEFGQENLWLSATALVGMAGIGMVISFGIRRVAAANPARNFPWNALRQTGKDLVQLYQSRALFLVAMGIVFFWSMGAMAQLNIDQFATESGAFDQSERIPLLVSLVLGVGVGSVLAGIWSGGRIELGMLSVSAAGISVFSMLLFGISDGVFNQGSWLNWPLFFAVVLLFCLGASAGVFDVPLAAYIQHRSPVQSRGSILSAANFLIYAGILFSALLFYAMRLPYHEGSLHNIPRDLASRDFSDDERFEIERRLSEYQSAWTSYQRNRDSSDATDRDANDATDSSGGSVDGDSNTGESPSTNDSQDSAQANELASNDLPVLERRRASERPLFEAYLDDPPAEIRDWLIATLLWEELKRRHQQGESFPVLEYFALCDEGDALRRDDKMLVKRVYEQSVAMPMFTSRQVFMVIGLIALPIFGFITWRLPQASARFMIWWFFQAWFRVRIHGLAAVPERGPSILIGSRNNWFHRLLLLLVTARKVRIVTWLPESERAAKRKWHDFWGVIHIAGGPTRVQLATAEARKTLRAGNLLAVFPEPFEEDGKTRTGFRSDLLGLADGIQIPLVPVLMDEVRFIENGKSRSLIAVLSGIISGWRQRICMNFVTAQAKPDSIHEVRRMLKRVGTMTDATTSEASEPNQAFVSPAQNFIRQAKRRSGKWKMGDSTGVSMTGGQLLMRTMILRRLLRKHVLGDQEKFVGLLMPPSAPGAVANLALTLDSRVAVNLNYTASEEVINSCIKQCGITHVLTSERVLGKLGYRPDSNLVMLEELREKLTLGDKLHGIMNSKMTSAAALERKLGLTQINPDDLLTIIFTSGSTGSPKGVMLTHNNVASNISSFNRVLQFRENDVLIGILPFFHSFGFTVSLWGTMSLDVGVAYHFNPLDAKQVGKLCETYKGTCLLSTPTFLRSYVRRCSREEFAALEVVVTGAEKLPQDVVEAFEKKFGVTPVEGYGTSELAPVACVNVPPGRSRHEGVIDAKPGTVGRPLPDVEASVRDLDSGQTLKANQPGMLWIKGPNVMKGYLGLDDLTKEVVVDGWYKTGDVAVVDDDGFVSITGRISRFSKIGGEMVPHIPVEEELNRCLGAEEDGMMKAAVTSLPDAKKGERLIVVHVKTDMSPADMVKELRDAGLSPLQIPATDAFVEVDEIPVLGTGKLDLSGIKQTAEQAFGGE